VAIDYVLALPHELNLEQQIELARSFAQYHFVDKGLIVDLSIHNKDDGNPHAHLYTTTRRLLGDQFDRLKARDLMPKVRNGFLIPEEEHIWNEKYRAFQESYFKANGLSLNVDPNHLIARRHEGRINEKNEDHYKKQENKLRHDLSVDIALKDPESLLNILGSQNGVFNEHTIAKTILRYCDSQVEFQNAMARVLGHRDCVALGIGQDGRETYTTRSNYLREAKMADQASSLLVSRAHVVSDTALKTAKQHYTLSEEQETALSHISLSGDISIVVGRAGTGKSYLMKAARQAWEKEGFEVSGVAVSGIAAKNLSNESGPR
jgi:ATP-dependent exoDNAse (exonuclease V) alpha subunit